tara:strand:+ start:61 stop:285 length:225 start_codon:yes stop_codon:yes gene_type:complete
MEYAVGDLLEENRNLWDTDSDCWRDYGLGIILNIDIEKKVARIYWFDVGVASYYKFTNMRKYLSPVSQPRKKFI